LKELNQKYSIKVENTYDMDEHRISLGAANTTRAIGEATRPVEGSTHRKLPESTEWVTVIEATSAGDIRTVPSKL
jgi:hypothetical protein